jgi:lipopolysaccharide export system permease protein
MIIYRYLSRQLLVTTIAVTGVLVMILVFGRFIKYLEDAAAGFWSGQVVVQVMIYRLPEFFLLILPLGLFLGILLTYGRMYLENEMVVLQACGMSQGRLVRLTMIPAVCTALIVAFLSHYLGPLCSNKAMALLAEERKRSALEMLTPGQFHSTRDGRTVTYLEGIDRNGQRMESLFILHYQPGDEGRVEITRARDGVYEVDALSNARYMVMGNGVRYEGVPGTARFSRMDYERYKLRLEPPAPFDLVGEYNLMSDAQLRSDGSPAALAELQWRWALPLLVPIVAYMAVPLSRVNPRQGRYLKLLPSIVMYLAYLSLLLAMRNKVAAGKVPADWGFLAVHTVFLMAAIMMHKLPEWRLRWQIARNSRLTGVAA